MLNCFKDYKRYGKILNWIWLDPSRWNKLFNDKTCCLSYTATAYTRPAEAVAALGARASAVTVLTPKPDYSVSSIKRVNPFTNAEFSMISHHWIIVKKLFSSQFPLKKFCSLQGLHHLDIRDDELTQWSLPAWNLISIGSINRLSPVQYPSIS